jgi:hypothetical protein
MPPAETLAAARVIASHRVLRRLFIRYLTDADALRTIRFDRVLGESSRAAQR